MSKTFKKLSPPWNNRNPFDQDARLRKAGAIEDRRVRRENEAGRGRAWTREWEEEEADERAFWDNFDRQASTDFGSEDNE